MSKCMSRCLNERADQLNQPLNALRRFKTEFIILNSDKRPNKRPDKRPNKINHLEESQIAECVIVSDNDQKLALKLASSEGLRRRAN